jgi:hypothetical protein
MYRKQLEHLEEEQLECPREHGTFRKEEVRRVNSAFIKASRSKSLAMYFCFNALCMQPTYSTLRKTTLEHRLTQ